MVERIEQIQSSLPGGTELIARSESNVFRSNDRAIKVYPVLKPKVIEMYAEATNLLADLFNQTRIDITSNNGTKSTVQLEIVRVEEVLDVAGFPATNSRFIAGKTLQEEFNDVSESDQIGQKFIQHMQTTLESLSNQISQTFGGGVIPQFSHINSKLSLEDQTLYITDIVPLVCIFELGF